MSIGESMNGCLFKFIQLISIIVSIFQLDGQGLFDSHYRFFMQPINIVALCQGVQNMRFSAYGRSTSCIHKGLYGISVFALFAGGIEPGKVVQDFRIAGCKLNRFFIGRDSLHICLVLVVNSPYHSIQPGIFWIFLEFSGKDLLNEVFV